MEQVLRTHLATLAKAFEAATGVTPASVGQSALKDNTFFPRVLDEGAGFTIKTFDRVVEWFAKHWPADLAWPDGIERPSLTKVEGEKAA